MKQIARFAFFSAFFLGLLVWRITGRSLQRDDSYREVSDGVNNGAEDNDWRSLLRSVKGSNEAEEECEQMYGFLPCSSNLPGHLFLIVVYEYLLYHGESYAGGDGRIFGVFGNNFFGASVFQLLDSLPDSLILLALGLSSSEEKTQVYVLTGAGLLAGSSILLLTLLWGVCLICGRRTFHTETSPEGINSKGIYKFLTGSGIVTDAETSYHAKVMFFSLLPFLVILLPSVFGLSSSSEGYKIVILVSLCVSVTCLFAYFFYQCYDKDERIQNRRLAYAEVERKVELRVPFYEVQALMLDREKHLMMRKTELEQVIKPPGPNVGEPMTRDEYLNMFEDWLDGTRKLMDDPYLMGNSGTEYNEVAKLLLEDKDKLIKQVSIMMERALQVNLHTENGTLDESAIDRFFDEIDNDKNGHITKEELKKFIKKINHNEALLDDKIADTMMRHLDNDRNGEIDKNEFRSGFRKWIKEIGPVKSNEKKKSHDQKQEITKHQPEKAKVWERCKAILLLIVGIFMLTVLAEPLVESVRKFSESVRINPFYVSFIFIPLATNARTAMAAIYAASQKSYLTTSFTFSEIYHKVFLNNILGFSVLVSVIYFRGLPWRFSVEILVMIIVCVIMGILASVRTKFPIWTLLVAFPLYPLSLVVVYLVDNRTWTT